LALSNSAIDVDGSNELLIDAYQASLNEPVLKQAWARNPPPTTLAQWMKVAQEEDLNYRQLMRFRKKMRPHDQSSFSKPKAPERSKDQTSTRYGYKKIRYVAPEDEGIEAEIDGDADIEDEVNLFVADPKTGNCFGCKKPGHFLNQCPNRSKFK